LGNRGNLRGRALVLKENVSEFSYKVIMKTRSQDEGQFQGAVLLQDFHSLLPFLCNKEFFAAKTRKVLSIFGLP
jgi:hypothetical protein